MALNKELWVKAMAELFYAKNDFDNVLPAHNDWISNNKVHIPQWGDNDITVTVNPTSWPITGVTSVTNEDKEVSLDTLRGPVIVLSTPIEDYEFSYDKKAEVLKNMVAQFREISADKKLLDLAGASGVTILTSTGSGRTALDADQTGNRKAITAYDLRAIKRKFDKANLPADGRFLVIPSDFQEDILSVQGFTSTYEMTNRQQVTYPDQIGMLYNMNVLVRSKVLVTNSSNTLVESNVITDASDNQAAIAFSTYCVGKADGQIDMFYDNANVNYQSDLISFLMRQKAFTLHKATKGVIVLAECAA